MEQANKALVLAMWAEVIDNHSEEAVMRYVSPDYIQHSTEIPDGRQGLLDGVRRLKNPPPGTPIHRKKTLVAAVAEGDLVTLTWTKETENPRNPGELITVNAFDMFRVKDGMVYEHWSDDGWPVR